MTDSKGNSLATPEQVQTALAQAREAGNDILDGLDEETKLALQEGQRDIRGVTPFAGIRQKIVEKGQIIGGLKFNDGRADGELPVHVLVLGVQRGRVCWDTNNLQSPPRCKSLDAQTRLDDVPDPGVKANGSAATACSDCIRSLWPNDRNRLADRMKNAALYQPAKPENSPECAEVLNILCCSPDGSDPWILSLHGTSIKPTDAYLGRIQRGMKLYTFQVVSELTTARETGPNGEYYVVRWHECEYTDADAVKAIMQGYKAFRDSLARSSEENLDRMASVGDEGEGFPTDEDGFPKVYE